MASGKWMICGWCGKRVLFRGLGQYKDDEAFEEWAGLHEEDCSLVEHEREMRGELELEEMKEGE